LVRMILPTCRIGRRAKNGLTQFPQVVIASPGRSNPTRSLRAKRSNPTAVVARSAAKNDPSPGSGQAPQSHKGTSFMRRRHGPAGPRDDAGRQIATGPAGPSQIFPKRSFFIAAIGEGLLRFGAGRSLGTGATKPA
jgi:hypothetical protein